MSTLLGDAPFVGRASELSFLVARLAEAAEGRGSVALIAGEAGIGKTRLLEELAAAADGTGAHSLWGRCHEGDGAPAFWPWVQMLRACLRGRSSEAVRQALGTRAPELAGLVPELEALFPGLPRPRQLPAAQERFRLFDAITTSLKAAATDKPLLLLLDDLHWADTASVLLLDFLAQELGEARLLVVGAFRDLDLHRGDPSQTVLGGLARRPHVARLDLTGLDVQSVAQCIEAAGGAPATADVATTLTKETEGNPLYVTQMVRLLSAEAISDNDLGPRLPVPPTLRDVIGRRLERLPSACVEALRVAAVVGREFHLPTVALAGGMQQSAVLDELEEAESAGIIMQAGATSGNYRFAHALIRESLYAELPSIRRARLHLRVAETIEALYGPRPVAHVAELAAHYRLAVAVTGAGKAAAYARQAGDAAAAVFAWEEAISQWKTALELAGSGEWPARCELLLAIGEAQNNVGEREPAKETLLKAAEAARHLRLDGGGLMPQGVRYLARAALGYGGPGVVLGALVQRQVNLLEEALAATRRLDPFADDGSASAGAAAELDWRGLSARLLARLALALFWTPRREQSFALSREAIAAARATADPKALIAALHTRRYVLWSAEHLDERSGDADEIVELAEAAGDAELTLQGLRWRVVDHLELGDIAAVDAAIERYQRLAGELRHPYYQWYASLFRATRAFAMGQYAEGERLAREALAFGYRTGDPDAEMFFTMQILPARTQQGRAAELKATLRDLAERYPTMVAYRSRLTVLYAELGQDTEARQAFDDIARGTADPIAGEFAAVPRDGNWLGTMVHFSRACVLLGDRVRAATLYELLRPFAGRNVMTGAAIASLGPTSYSLAGLAGLLGQPAEAVAYFEAALEMATRMEATPQLALTQHAFAELLLADAAPSPLARARADDLLARSLATAQALGMAPLEAEIHRTLAGSDPVRQVEVGQLPDGLSAREAEVLRLVATGRSNREIAEALVLSVVTVQNHIANIYRKADIHNRAEAATYALRHGLSEPNGAVS